MSNDQSEAVCLIQVSTSESKHGIKQMLITDHAKYFIHHDNNNNSNRRSKRCYPLTGCFPAH